MLKDLQTDGVADDSGGKWEMSVEWFESEYPNHSKLKLDMGKSCIRFKNIEQIPYSLIGELMRKMSVKKWIALYENNVRKRRARTS